MKSNAPWSVKGIERDARETAKEAAHREGMTVGAWLNQMIYSAGDPDQAGAIEGLKVDDIVTAIDHLSQRVANAETKSAEAIEDLSKNVGGVVERLQRLERVKPATDTNEDLAARVEKIEAKSNDRQRIDTLKALEKAVGQIALQFETAHKQSVERLDANEKQLQELATRIDADGQNEGTAGAIGFLKDAVDGLSARIARAERIASEAARLSGDAGGNVDEEFVERTGKRLRILGDEIKRGGDQIRTLEATIGKLSAQIDAAERRSSEGVQKVAETISELRSQFKNADGAESGTREEIEAAVAAATQRTENRIASLQHSFEEMISRLEGKARNENAEADAAAPAKAGATTGTRAAVLSQALAPETSARAPEHHPEHAIDDDLDAEFDDAFASIDLDEETDVEPQPSDVEGETEDEFSFDLDADEDETASLSPDASEAEDILSQVQDAFGEGGGRKEASADAGSAPVSARAQASEDSAVAENDEASDDTGLDAVLAELDGMGFSTREEDGDDDGTSSSDANESAGDAPTEDDDEEPSVFGRKQAPPGEDAAPAASDEGGQSKAPDFLKDARRKAREAAARAEAEEGQGKKRKLTPKQRAILAARIRRKRMEAGGAPEKSATSATLAKAALKDKTASKPQAKPAADQLAADEIDETEEKKQGLVATLTSMLPFLGKKGLAADDENDEPAAANEAEPTARQQGRPAKGKAAPASKGVSDDDFDMEDEKDDPVLAEDGNPNISNVVTRAVDKAKQKPVTLALGAAILLAVAALFFLVKDLAAGPSQRTTPQIAATGDSGAVDSPAPALKEDASVEVPAPPLVRPRALYLESITALRSATTEAEERNALQGLQEAAALGHPPAQLQIGELYKIGQGFDKDLAQARVWYERAANGGNVLAMHRMGVMTARGEGGPADIEASIGWFEQAGNFGLVDSQYNLGATFHPSADGATEIQDRGKAYFWYSLAAANGDSQAGALAAGLGEAMTPEARAALDAEVAAWTPLTPDPDANELASAS